MSKYKIYIILSILIFTSIVIALVYFFVNENVNQTVMADYPDSVKSVINSPLEKISDNFLNLVVEEDFIISYGGDLNQGTFFITANAEPVIEVSKRAEQSFLNKLGISKDYACQLEVILNVPSIIDNNLSEYDFGLSFCPGRPHIEDVPRDISQSNQYIDGTAGIQEDEFNIR